jgi:hypothetical protein
LEFSRFIEVFTASSAGIPFAPSLSTCWVATYTSRLVKVTRNAIITQNIKIFLAVFIYYLLS